MKRVLCIRFPDWSLQRVRVAQPEHKQRPLVLFSDCGRDGLCVTACSPDAARRGVVSLMSTVKCSEMVRASASAKSARSIAAEGSTGGSHRK